jgi:hypothetical protein
MTVAWNIDKMYVIAETGMSVPDGVSECRIQSWYGLKQGDTLSLILFNFALE